MQVPLYHAATELVSVILRAVQVPGRSDVTLLFIFSDSVLFLTPCIRFIIYQQLDVFFLKPSRLRAKSRIDITPSVNMVPLIEESVQIDLQAPLKHTPNLVAPEPGALLFW